MKNRDVVRVIHFRDRLDVFDRNRLAASRVVCNCYHTEWDFFGARFFDEGLELGDVHVAFERVWVGGIESFINDEIGRASAAGADVGIGGVEVHVARNIMTGLDQTRRQNIFGGASLMRRDKIFETENILDRGFETIVRARTCYMTRRRA